MKYYYAIVYCNSIKAASRLIDENQGLEFELTNIKLNLSCVADDLTFPQKPKEQATEVPPNYTFNSGAISRALNHSTVTLSWDQSDKKRQKLLENNYKAILKRRDDELGEGDDFNAYKDLIAGSSSEDDEDEISDNGSDE